MEECFHDCNDKDEVNVSRGEISKVLSALQKFFPRLDHTNGYSIPKTHGMTKMQSYIMLFGSGINFYGGPGEAAHKSFMKSAQQKTQRRLSKFAKQTAHQYYYMMLSSCAVQHLTECSSRLVRSVEVSNEDMIHSKHQENDDNVQVLLSGQYEINVSQAVINEMQTEHTVTVAWLTENTDKNRNLKYKLSKDLVWCLHNSFGRSNYKDYWIHKSHCKIQLK
jgi:hypothetical protein